jgi:hypothetical protein
MMCRVWFGWPFGPIWYPNTSDTGRQGSQKWAFLAYLGDSPIKKISNLGFLPIFEPFRQAYSDPIDSQEPLQNTLGEPEEV